MDAGKAIRIIAESKGIKQSDICEITGIPDGYMSQLFNSKIVNPRFDRICAIADAIGVSLDEISRLGRMFDDPSKEKQK